MKHLLFFVLFIFLTQEVMAEDKKCSFLPLEDTPKIDTRDWIPFQFTLVYDDHTHEHGKVLLPSEPQFVNRGGMQSPGITVTDNEGMTYTFSRMLIPDENFNFEKSVEFLAASISASTTKRLLGWGKLILESNPYFLIWVKGDKMTRLTLVKSEHFVCFLETTVCREIYRDFDIKNLNTHSEVIRDSLKTNVFTRSFTIQ